MAKRKPKPQHPALVSMREAQERVANAIAARIEQDALAAYKTIVDVQRSGDLNGERRQAAKLLLEIAAVYSSKQSTSVTATTEQDDDGKGKMTIEVVHIDKPKPEDDDE